MPDPNPDRCGYCGQRDPGHTRAVPADVTIRYEMTDGRAVKVRLHQVGDGRVWVLDLYMGTWDGLSKVHQHSIEGEPEVTIR